MKSLRSLTIVAGIGTIVALGLMGIQLNHAYAEEDSTILKLYEISKEISILQDDTKNFDINKIGSQTFKFKTIGNSLLEVQQSEIDDEDVLKVIDHLTQQYLGTFNEYKGLVKEYQKNNGLTLQKRQIVTDLLQHNIDFKTKDERHENKYILQQFVKEEIKRVNSEEKFQKLINQVGVELADAHKGNKIPNIYHEVALEKIFEKESWDLAPAALDRITNQYTDEDIKTKLVQYKEKIEDSIKKLEKNNNRPSKVLTLTSGQSGTEIILF